jgi:hypothetical protein
VSAYAPDSGNPQAEHGEYADALRRCFVARGRDILVVGTDTNSSLGVRLREFCLSGIIGVLESDQTQLGASVIIKHRIASLDLRRQLQLREREALFDAYPPRRSSTIALRGTFVATTLRSQQLAKYFYQVGYTGVLQE